MLSVELFSSLNMSSVLEYSFDISSNKSDFFEDSNTKCFNENQGSYEEALESGLLEALKSIK